MKNQLRSFPNPDHLAGQLLYDLIGMYDLVETMEVGALHKATCIYAAAAHLSRGIGTHIALDYTSPEERTNSLLRLSNRLGLSAHCSFDLSSTSLHWRMMKLLGQADITPFDLCFVVGRQTWSHAGFAALLALRLLRAGGWLVLSDVEHTYVTDTGAPEHLVKGMSEEERRAKQIYLVFTQLLATDPSICNAIRIGKLLIVQKQNVSTTISLQTDRRSILKQANAVNTAYQRSAFDPDFRRALLDSPSEVLISLGGGQPLKNSTAMRFHDRPNTRFVLPAEHRKELHVILPAPVWQSVISEQELERLITLAQQSTPA